MRIVICLKNCKGRHVVLVVKNLPADAENSKDMDLIPGLGRTSGEGNGNLLKYSCWGNPIDRGAIWILLKHHHENVLDYSLNSERKSESDQGISMYRQNYHS